MHARQSPLIMGDACSRRPASLLASRRRLLPSPQATHASCSRHRLFSSHVLVVSLALVLLLPAASAASAAAAQSPVQPTLTFVESLSPRVVSTKHGNLQGVLISIRSSDAAAARTSPTVAASRSSSQPSPQASDVVRGLDWRPVEAFRGVAFAMPPVGSLRFMPPVTPSHWRGLRAATRHAAACIQRPPSQPFTDDGVKVDGGAWRRPASAKAAPVNQSEDCLYLNVYAPLSPSLPPTTSPSSSSSSSQRKQGMTSGVCL